MRRTKILTLLIAILSYFYSIAQSEPMNLGVVGLTHGHAHWVFNAEKDDIFEISGIVEPNKELVKRYAKQYGFSMDLVYESLDQFLNDQKPDAVAAFGNIYDHLQIVQSCAPLGIHVMVEKPLAVSLDHAKEIEALAKEHEIHLITNYETTWYPTNHKAYELLHVDDLIGEVRKVVVRDGHRGPKKIGVDKEFLEWLTDPVLNGGGAVIDFGCYGANLLTWIMKGERPKKVTAITMQQQSENNPHVDDEAIILLEYENAVGIIQASWNWPMGRKDMEIYGLKGAIYADNRHDLRVRIAEGYDGFKESKMTLEERQSPNNDPFAFLKAILNGDIEMEAFALSSLENNVIVAEILDAAIRSAKSGKSVTLR